MILTREVRWFFDGTIPSWFVDWFENVSGPLFQEVRSDVYDLEAAHQNVGLKRRSPANTLDCKMRLWSEELADLGFGIQGNLEDWIKISQPLKDSTIGPGRVEVLKATMSKRFYLDTNTGCEAEIADISVGSIAAWTLCLETFGEAELRDDAMRHGLEALFGVDGPPSGLFLSGANSHSYPEWLSLYSQWNFSGGPQQAVGIVPDLPTPDHESQAS